VRLSSPTSGCNEVMAAARASMLSSIPACAHLLFHVRNDVSIVSFPFGSAW
jgi:hypothetical protein